MGFEFVHILSAAVVLAILFIVWRLWFLPLAQASAERRSAARARAALARIRGDALFRRGPWSWRAGALA